MRVFGFVSPRLKVKDDCGPVARTVAKTHPEIFSDSDYTGPETFSTYMIAMTGYGQDEDKRMAITAGFDQHLTKPIAIESLEHLQTGG